MIVLIVLAVLFAVATLLWGPRRVVEALGGFLEVAWTRGLLGYRRRPSASLDELLALPIDGPWCGCGSTEDAVPVEVTHPDGEIEVVNHLCPDCREKRRPAITEVQVAERNTQREHFRDTDLLRPLGATSYGRKFLDQAENRHALDTPECGYCHQPPHPYDGTHIYQPPGGAQERLAVVKDQMRAVAERFNVEGETMHMTTQAAAEYQALVDEWGILRRQIESPATATATFALEGTVRAGGTTFAPGGIVSCDHEWEDRRARRTVCVRCGASRPQPCDHEWEEVRSMQSAEPMYVFCSRCGLRDPFVRRRKAEPRLPDPGRIELH